MSNPLFVWYYIDPKDTRPLADKVRECAVFYKQKMDAEANLCLSHPDTLGNTTLIDGIELRPSKAIQRNNFYLTRTDD